MVTDDVLSHSDLTDEARSVEAVLFLLLRLYHCTPFSSCPVPDLSFFTFVRFLTLSTFSFFFFSVQSFQANNVRTFGFGTLLRIYSFTENCSCTYTNLLLKAMLTNLWGSIYRRQMLKLVFMVRWASFAIQSTAGGRWWLRTLTNIWSLNPGLPNRRNPSSLSRSMFFTV